MKKPVKITLEQLIAISKKREMVLKVIETHFPKEVKEFLIYMAKGANPFANYANCEVIDLVDFFIEFEEQENEGRLTKVVMEQLMLVYGPMYLANA